jgi:hypothetical protein
MGIGAFLLKVLSSSIAVPGLWCMRECLLLVFFCYTGGIVSWGREAVSDAVASRLFSASHVFPSLSLHTALAYYFVLSGQHLVSACQRIVEQKQKALQSVPRCCLAPFPYVQRACALVRSTSSLWLHPFWWYTFKVLRSDFSRKCV